MKLSPGEKLILVAMADAQRDASGEAIDLQFIRNAILSGDTWALSWELTGFGADEVPTEVVDETAEILTMWRFIENSVGRLNEADKEKAEAEASPFNLKFGGFDANNDRHFGVASFMINDIGRYEDFKGRYLNSHSRGNLLHYRSMLPFYRECMENTRFTSNSLTVDEILTIVKAGWVDTSA